MTWFVLAQRRRRRELLESFRVMRMAAHGEGEKLKNMVKELESD